MSEQKEPVSGANEQDLQAEIARLNKIIQAMMNRSERNASIQGSDFNLFQTAVTLEDQVRQRTVELEEARLETEKITRTLRERENNYRLLLENSPMSIHEIDMDGRIISMSRAGILMHGLKVGENLQGSLYLDGVSATDRERIRKLLSKACAGEISHFEFKASGPREPIFKSCFVPIKNKNGNVEKLMGITEDITERKKAEEAIEQNEIFLNTLLNSIPIPIFYKDRDGRYTGFNRAYEKFFGATKEKLIGKTVFDISPPELAKIYYAKDNELLESGVEQEYESQVKNTFGVIRDVIFNKAVFTDSQGKISGMIGAILDITERKLAEEQIKHLATHDLLTDLPSLRLAKDRLATAINLARRYKKSAAVMFIDLDGFKAVNDTLGHDAGDFVLKQLAQRMLSCVRKTDTVARIGGDEFLIIATELHIPDNAAKIAEKLIHQISQPIIFNGRQAVVGASIGIALFPADDMDMDQLIKKADEAMYRIKKAGKSGFCFINTKVS
jgi:diguanylate cyclase (GGDEF)-like protein/PAS domain S-box-containing protein